MVLKESVLIRMILCMLYCLLVSCSMLNKQGAKRDLIVPAQIPEQVVKEEKDLPKHDSNPKPKQDAKLELDLDSTENESASENIDVLDAEKTHKSSASGTDLLSTLLGKATKALNLQQWLRAQRALEQALRINPESSQAYVLYGDVYKGMGLEEKSIEMYKRAIFLSGNDEQLRNKLFPKSMVD